MAKMANMPYDKFEIEAIRRFESGENPQISTGICESVTMGYGDLDEWGYWEFSLPSKFHPGWIKEFNAIRWAKDPTI